MKVNGKMYTQGMDVPQYIVYPLFIFYILFYTDRQWWTLVVYSIISSKWNSSISHMSVYHW